MVKNRIKVKLAEAEMTAATLSSKLPDDINKVCMSFIQAGKVLPTIDGLRAMCEVFKCTPTDIYDPTDLDLLSLVGKRIEVKAEAPAPAQPATREQSIQAATVNEAAPSRTTFPDNRHTGMQQLRVWMPVEEKIALVKAVRGLGYVSIAEWLREMVRKTLKDYIALNLKKNTIHQAVNSTTQNQTV